MSCIFCKIAKKESPAAIVYEDDFIMCFRDMSPQAPIHCLLIPKKHVADLFEVQGKDWEIIGHLMRKVPDIAGSLGLEEKGFRVVNNCKAMAGQSVFHLHFHLMGGRSFGWPPG
jgi:histidine triad (HIT) family protein